MHAAWKVYNIFCQVSLSVWNSHVLRNIQWSPQVLRHLYGILRIIKVAAMYVRTYVYSLHKVHRGSLCNLCETSRIRGEITAEGVQWVWLHLSFVPYNSIAISKVHGQWQSRLCLSIRHHLYWCLSHKEVLAIEIPLLYFCFISISI